MARSYFYNRTIRKYIVLFGSLFNDITVMTRDADWNSEINRSIVPINWSAKEKYIQKIANQSETPQVQTVLPRLSFELISITYDPTRKQQNIQRSATLNSSTNSEVWSTYSAAPYNFGFRLNVHARNIEDLTQILEQIIPYYQPDQTITANLIDNLVQPKDIKVLLQAVDPIFGYEGPLGDNTRDVAAVLTFQLQGYLWGPITSQKVITKVIVNTYVEQVGPVRLMLGAGSGTYPVGDSVYQGNSYYWATSTGIVRNFYQSNNSTQLLISVTKGEFEQNLSIKSTTTNASYVLSTFGDNNYPVMTITVTPSPPTANADSVFGLDFEITHND